MPCDDFAIYVNQDRVGESPLFDACGYLRHLLVAVGATVPCVRDNGFYLSTLNLIRRPRPSIFHGCALYVICKQYRGFLLGNKDPLNMPVSRRPVKESLVYGATQTNREGERLALAEKVTQF